MAGKDEVLIKFNAEDAALVQKIMNVRSELLKTGASAQIMGENFAGAGKLAQEVGAGMASQLGLITSGAAAGAAAVKLLWDTWKNYQNEIDTHGKNFLGRVERLNESMGNTGRQGDINDVRSEIAQQSRQGVGPMNQIFSEKQITEQFAEINDAVPASTPTADVWEATKLGLKAKTGGMSGTSIGVNYARLKAMGGVSNLEDSATGLSIYGKDLDFWTLLERAKDNDEIIRIIEASGQVNEPKKSVQGLLNEANGDANRLEHFIHNPNTAPSQYRLSAASIGRGLQRIGPVSLDKMVSDYQKEPYDRIALNALQAQGAEDTAGELSGEHYANVLQERQLRRAIFDTENPRLRKVWGLSWLAGQNDAFGEYDRTAALEKKQGYRATDTQTIQILQDILNELKNGHLSDLKEKVASNPTLANNVPGQQ